MTDPDSSLRDLFESAQDFVKKLEKLESNSQSYHDQLRSAIATLERCRGVADQISLFSPNETADDISSADLQYLSIDYWLGNLTARHHSAERKSILHQSQEAYERYLARLDDYELLGKNDKALYERFQEDKATFSLLGNGDATQRRDAKIARYRQEKDLKQKLELLSRSPQAEDSTIRDLNLAQLAFYAHQTFDGLSLLSQELSILANIPEEPTRPGPEPDARSRSAASSAYSARLDPPLSSLVNGSRNGPLLSKSGKPLKPFVLLDSRQTVRNGVFKPGHNLPTMSIDEYLEEERKRGGMIDGGGETAGSTAPVDEDDLDKADEETMKQRRWDDFVEENPKGAGNTINRG